MGIKGVAPALKGEKKNLQAINFFRPLHPTGHGIRLNYDLFPVGFYRGSKRILYDRRSVVMSERMRKEEKGIH